MIAMKSKCLPLILGLPFSHMVAFKSSCSLRRRVSEGADSRRRFQRSWCSRISHGAPLALLKKEISSDWFKMSNAK
ncbi:hypothetical protein BDP55DRAFT_665079 [Colletotrichum godetiae]|uniref:Uncharacterized protein n=1 Tax=Colletotrichum godetiae TaxID=1209918 RepID=A0AAJ0AL77_9PEZI|nr:uncharacterized protein BDP55DRAFT_665079 [Colletotrichum godetiae]KAK1675299.1 hypothetical protein BDP55DRAFT_665079 [Colletotrichum godetiae]